MVSRDLTGQGLSTFQLACVSSSRRRSRLQRSIAACRSDQITSTTCRVVHSSRRMEDCALRPNVCSWSWAYGLTAFQTGDQSMLDLMGILRLTRRCALKHPSRLHSTEENTLATGTHPSIDCCCTAM